MFFESSFKWSETNTKTMTRGDISGHFPTFSDIFTPSCYSLPASRFGDPQSRFCHRLQAAAAPRTHHHIMAGGWSSVTGDILRFLLLCARQAFTFE